MQTKKIAKEPTFQYHPELIALYNSGIVTGAVIGNILTPLLFIVILYDYIPHNILWGWFIFALFVALLRLLLPLKFSKYSLHYQTFMRWAVVASILSGLIWGFASILTYLYAPEIYLSFVIMLIAGLISATTTTLTPLYKTYVAYVLSAMFPLMVILFMMSTTIHVVTGLLIIVFGAFVLLGGYKNYKKLYEVIILKDRLKRLNHDLEGEVKKRTLELEVLNDSLEMKVAEEISKNRAKDQQLLQQSRMAQMGEMISMIAHQWRQPLGAIAASSIDLKMKIAFSSFDLDDEEGKKACVNYFDEQLNHIESYVQNLTTTIDDFRNFYKPNKEKKILSINTPIEKSLSIIEAA